MTMVMVWIFAMIRTDILTSMQRCQVPLSDVAKGAKVDFSVVSGVVNGGLEPSELEKVRIENYLTKLNVKQNYEVEK